jgi:hypothetical protein
MSRALSAVAPRAYLETTIDVASIPANSDANIDVPVPRTRWRPGAPIFAEPVGDLPAGILLSHVRCEADAPPNNKIRFRLRNTTGAAIDPPPQTYRFTQF